MIEVLFEMVTDAGAPLLVNVAVLLGTVLGVGVELQLVPVVHSAPGPVQVPSTARAASGANVASVPSHAPPSSAARKVAERGHNAAASFVGPQVDAAAARSRPCKRCERMT